MAEPLGNLTRTHTCGVLRAGDVGADVVLLGWVHRVRDLGGVTFIDIRDRAGVSQVVVRENDTLMPIAKKLRSEFVIGVSGVVQRRSEDTINTRGSPRTVAKPLARLFCGSGSPGASTRTS